MTVFDDIYNTNGSSHGISECDLKWVARPIRRIPVAIASPHALTAMIRSRL